MASQATQNGNQAWGAPFPALHLWPLQDTFSMKMIHLPDHQRIKIGRQTNQKTVPGERNAYFDSKVLSRTHAEIWNENGKIFIKDVRSSNGTFVNGERLSAEGAESPAAELNNEDLVEFGIDIISEDNRTIIHHKVAAKVYCVFNAEDAALSSREMAVYQNQDTRGPRRPAAQQMGSQAQGPQVMSAGGKAVSFDHVLQKLQAELQRSRDESTDLNGLASQMNEIQDTLAGGMAPTQNGSAPEFIPPQYRSKSAEVQAAINGPHGQQAAAYMTLQNQLTETQSSLATHLDKIRDLEGQVHGHEATRHEVSQVKEQMEETKREMDLLLASTRGRQRRVWDDDDDDDAKSVATVMPEEDDGPDLAAQNAALTARVETMSAEIADVIQLSKSLQVQHGEAMSAVQALTDRIGALETGFTSRVAEEVSKTDQKWESWKIKFEETHRKDRESWEAERERLRGVVREWEEASRRAHEEEEERELNEEMSGEEGEVSLGWKDLDDETPTFNTSRKGRRRRPSHRAGLAIDALKAVAEATGSSTPKQTLQELDTGRNELRTRASRARKAELPRTGSTSTIRDDKDSSDSGKSSVGGTLNEGEELEKRTRSIAQPTIIITVIAVAVVAGVYLNHRE